MFKRWVILLLVLMALSAVIHQYNWEKREDYLDAQGQKIDGQLIFARDSTEASIAVLNILPEARTVVSVQRSI